MQAYLILSIIAIYFTIIFTISYFTGRKTDNRTYFLGGKQSPWYIVAIGMIGTSISGVTFISVPGMVSNSAFGYLQMVLGFVMGYVFIAYVLLPLYYRIELASIYGYLKERFGVRCYKTGSIFFLISKFLGCGVRMYLTAIVLQVILFDSLNIPFGLNVLFTMIIVWLYTARGGVKTLVWVDMLQTFALIGAVISCIMYIGHEMGFNSITDISMYISDSPMSKIWYFDDINDKQYFWKQFLAGMFTTIAMTGLDQDMMQKNLSCKNLKEARKNVLSYGISFLPVNLLFLALGVLLYGYAAQVGLFDPENNQLFNGIKPDELFPTLATQTNPITSAHYLPPICGILFTIGLISAAFSSAGSAITALTTSVSIDLLGKADIKFRSRFMVHIVCCCIMGCLIYLFGKIGTGSVIDAVYILASYTYGPLLGLYLFGLYTPIKANDKWIPGICISAPILCLYISNHTEKWFGYHMGYELLLLNAGLTALGLYVSSFGKTKNNKKKI